MIDSKAAVGMFERMTEEVCINTGVQQAGLSATLFNIAMEGII